MFSRKPECLGDRQDKVLECESRQSLSLHLRTYLQGLVVEAGVSFKMPFSSLQQTLSFDSKRFIENYAPFQNSDKGKIPQAVHVFTETKLGKTGWHSFNNIVRSLLCAVNCGRC